jgi:hypothetical protein
VHPGRHMPTLWKPFVTPAASYTLLGAVDGPSKRLVSTALLGLKVSTVHYDYCVLECDVMQSGGPVPPFRRKLLPPAVCSQFIHTVGNVLRGYMPSHFRKQSSFRPLPDVSKEPAASCHLLLP